MVFRLKILCRWWWFGKCFFNSFKNILPVLVLIFWLNGGLNQIMFRLLFLLVFTSVWAYDIDVLYPLSYNDFSYKSFALSNSSLLQDNADNRRWFRQCWFYILAEWWVKPNYIPTSILVGFHFCLSICIYIFYVFIYIFYST